MAAVFLNSTSQKLPRSIASSPCCQENVVILQIGDIRIQHLQYHHKNNGDSPASSLGDMYGKQEIWRGLRYTEIFVLVKESSNQMVNHKSLTALVVTTAYTGVTK